MGDDPLRVNPLDLVDHLLREYLELREHEYVALSLWSLHSHVYERFMNTRCKIACNIDPQRGLFAPTSDPL